MYCLGKVEKLRKRSTFSFEVRKDRLLREFGIKEKKNIKLLYKLPYSFKIFCYTFLGLEMEMSRASEIIFPK